MARKSRTRSSNAPRNVAQANNTSPSHSHLHPLQQYFPFISHPDYTGGEPDGDLQTIRRVLDELKTGGEQVFSANTTVDDCPRWSLTQAIIFLTALASVRAEAALHAQDQACPPHAIELPFIEEPVRCRRPGCHILFMPNKVAAQGHAELHHRPPSRTGKKFIINCGGTTQNGHVCTQFFKFESLGRHWVNCHIKPTRFYCPVCSVEGGAMRPDSMQRHIKTCWARSVHRFNRATKQAFASQCLRDKIYREAFYKTCIRLGESGYISPVFVSVLEGMAEQLPTLVPVVETVYQRLGITIG